MAATPSSPQRFSMNGGYPLRPVAPARTRPLAGLVGQPGTANGRRLASGPWQLSRDNVLSFLSMNLARLASSATQLSPIRRQFSSACALMQAGGLTGEAGWASAQAIFIGTSNSRPLLETDKTGTLASVDCQ